MSKFFVNRVILFCIGGRWMFLAADELEKPACLY